MNKKIAYIAISAALISVISPISIPIGVISITFSLFIIYVIASIFPLQYSLASILIYILIGIIGLPVFSNFNGGIGVICGPTGGYIIGYIPSVLVVWSTLKLGKNKFFIYPISMILATIVCYIVGTLWFSFTQKTTFTYALTICVVPFILVDLIKIAFASITSYYLNKNLKFKI